MDLTSASAAARLKDETGQTSVEYGLIVSVVVGLVIALAVVVGPLSNFFGSIVTTITSAL